MEKEIKKSPSVLRRELRERTTGYIVTALGLVAGLAWNEAIGSLIKFLYPLSENGIIPKFIYAILITVVVVVLSTQLLRVAGPKE